MVSRSRPDPHALQLAGTTPRAYDLGMKKSTRQIIKTALGADETVRPDQVDAVMSLLNERPPTLEANRPLPLLMTQAEAGRLLCVSRFGKLMCTAGSSGATAA